MNINEIEKAEILHLAHAVSRKYAERVRKLLFDYDAVQVENERLRKQHDTDVIAELESAHKMMAARNERLQKENDALAKALRKAKEFYEGITSFYGQELQVYNWHMNGEPEPFDNFIDDNMPDGLEESFKVLRKYGLEGKEE